MPNVFHSFLLVIAGSTQKDLARQIKFLKVENEILRGKLPKRITITPKERRRLTKFGQRLGKAIHELTTIVALSTLLRWIREEKRDGKKVPAKRGRRRTPEQIRRLILKLAKENEWGYTRILGELRKLGIRSISRNTVKRILKGGGLDPGPKRGEGTWDEFLKMHAASLWQCDFLSKRIVTRKGLRDAFVLVFLNVKTRQVIASQASLNPDEEWVVDRGRAAREHVRRLIVAARGHSPGNEQSHSRLVSDVRSIDAPLYKPHTVGRGRPPHAYGATLFKS